MHPPALSRSAALPTDGCGAEWVGALALIWAGMVLGVSFLATPVKFLVKSLPRPIALDVGRQTFRTFGYVETVPAVLLGVRAASTPRQRLLAAAPGAIVLAQALWLRPRLSARARQIGQGGAPPPASALHLVYVACEVTKLGALLGLGLSVATRDANGDGNVGTLRRGSNQEG